MFVVGSMILYQYPKPLSYEPCFFAKFHNHLSYIVYPAWLMRVTCINADIIHVRTYQPKMNPFSRQEHRTLPTFFFFYFFLKMHTPQIPAHSRKRVFFTHGLDLRQQITGVWSNYGFVLKLPPCLYNQFSPPSYAHMIVPYWFSEKSTTVVYLSILVC